MKKNDITIGATYIAKVSDKLVEVRIDGENSHGGWDATNLATKKKVRIKSAQRLRRPAKDEKKSDAKASAKSDPDRIPLKEAMKTETKSKKNGAPKKLSALDGAAKLLADSGEPMRCGDIVTKLINDGMWKTSGKTPAATLYSAILREINVKGAASRFKKSDRGLFTLTGKGA